MTRRPSGRAIGDTTVLRIGTSGALTGAAALHASVVGEHSQEWALAGLFFVGLQAVQTLLAVTVWLRWSRGLAAAVTASSLGALAVWLVSRTTGLPLGPAGFRVPEELGSTDVACALLEVMTILLVLPAWRRRPAATPRLMRPRSSATRTVVAAGVLLAAVALLTFTGLRPGLHDDEHEHTHSAVPDAATTADRR
jgi:hypothetical protein